MARANVFPLNPSCLSWSGERLVGVAHYYDTEKYFFKKHYANILKVEKN